MNHPLYFATSNSNSPIQQEEEIGEVCIANISPLERRKRLVFSIRQLAITLVILVVLVILDVNPLWRWPLFFMFSAATSSYIQARDKT